MEFLNPQQREAANIFFGPLRIIAGPGTGKTRVLVERTINLIQQHGVQPQRILLLTFTNKAAHEIKERLVSRGFGAVQAMTFHSLAARWLREFWNKDFEIVESKEGDARTDKILITFDELLTTLLSLWHEQPEILKACQSRYDCLMVDEYQDVNADQIEIARLLVEPHRQICVVGDPDQCIYSWRGSRPDSLEHFVTLFPDAKTIILTENYRNPPKILGAAMQLMAREPRPRLMHPLRAISTVDAPVNLWSFGGNGERDAVIISLLEKHLGSHVDMVQADELDHIEPRTLTSVSFRPLDFARGKPSRGGVGGGRVEESLGGVFRHFEDIAILFRTQEEGRGIARLLRQKGYPYQMSSPENFWEREEIEEFLRSLSIMSSVPLCHSDRLEDGIGGRGAEESLTADAKSRARDSSTAPFSTTPLSSARNDTSGQVFSTMVHARLSSFVASHSFTDDQQTALLQLLPLSMDFDTLPINEALTTFLDLPKLAEDQDNIIRAPGINLLTLHAAKGLEFPIVIITGLSDGNIPQRSALHDPLELAEERRLLYVGMTRAKEELHLMTSPIRRFGCVLPVEKSPSSGPDEVTKQGFGSPQKIDSKIPSSGAAGSRFLNDMLGGDWFEQRELHPSRLKTIKRRQAKRAQMKMF